MRRRSRQCILLLAVLLALAGCEPTAAERIQPFLGKTGRARIESELEDSLPLRTWIDAITLIAIDEESEPPQLTLRFEFFSQGATGSDHDPVDLEITIEQLLEFEIDGKVVYVREK